jgi:hypothetical protein
VSARLLARFVESPLPLKGHHGDGLNPVVGQKAKNPQLREWHTKHLKKLPGLMRTLWVCHVAGEPFQFAANQAGLDPARP